MASVRQQRRRPASQRIARKSAPKKPNAKPSKARDTEGDVETRVILPLLERLQWPRDETHSKVPVRSLKTGSRRGRDFEADFVLAPPEPRPPKEGWVVVEAKRPGESLEDAAGQARSYCNGLNALLYLVCNGERLQVWQVLLAASPERVFETSIMDLDKNWGDLDLCLSRTAVLALFARVRNERVIVGEVDVSLYLQALLRAGASRRLCDRRARTADGESVVLGSDTVHRMVSARSSLVLVGAANRRRFKYCSTRKRSAP